MAVMTKEAQKIFGKIKKNVEDSYKDFKDNRKRFSEFMDFIFHDSLSQHDRDVLVRTGKPDIQFNSIEPYLSRLYGEFYKTSPSFEVRAMDDSVDAMTVEAVGGIMRGILYEANNDNNFSYNVYREITGGGYSVMKVWTEYDHEESFDQKIKIGKVFDPTLTGFDPLARRPDKSDGQFAFELYPKSLEEFKEEYPDEDTSQMTFNRNIQGFTWNYEQMNAKVVLMADYYAKKKKRFRLHYLSNGETLSDKEYKQLIEQYEADPTNLTQPPVPVSSRWSERTVIMRYVMIEDRILESEETNYPHLPLIFVDGNSVYVKKEKMSPNSPVQVTRPYAYHAMGAQKLKNFAGQSLGNELENMMQSKYILEHRSIPSEEALQDWISPQKVSTLVYQSEDKDKNPLPPPQVVQRPEVPAIITQTFTGSDQIIQNILGSYDAQLGINENQLSGVAIVEGATQNNSVAMPYIVGFMTALNNAAQMILEMIPEYYTTPRTVPIVHKDGSRDYLPINQPIPNIPNGVSTDYDSTALDVEVKAGYNFEVQKNRALEMMTKLMASSRGFNQLMDENLPILVDNLDIKGNEQLKEAAEQFMQKQQQMAAQNAQNNPAVIQQQLAQQNLQLREKKMQSDNQFRAKELTLEEEKIQDQRFRDALDAHTQLRKDTVQLAKSQTERDVKAADLTMSLADQQHKHTKDTLEMANTFQNLPTGE